MRGGRAASTWRFAPPRSPGASPRSIYGTAPEARRLRASAFRGIRFSCLHSSTYNISRRIGLTFRPGVLSPSSCKLRFPYRWRFLIRLRQTPREGGIASRKKNGRLRARPPSARAIPSATVPGRFSMSEGFHHFDIEETKARPPIRMLKHFHRVRSYACMPKRPWHGLKTKKKRAADAALFLNRYIWRQSYASLKNFFLPT